MITVTKDPFVTRVSAIAQLATDLAALVRKGERMGVQVRVSIHGLDAPTFDELPGENPVDTDNFRSKGCPDDGEVENSTLCITYFTNEGLKGGESVEVDAA